MNLLDRNHPVHGARFHTAAIAGTIAVIGLSMFAYGDRISSIDKAMPPRYEASDADIAALPFGKHAYTIYVNDSAGSFGQRLAIAIQNAGDDATVQGDIAPHTGIWLSPDTPEGHRLADTLGALVHENIRVANSFNPGDFEIGIGAPTGR